jgi:TolB-like protein
MSSKARGNQIWVLLRRTALLLASLWVTGAAHAQQPVSARELIAVLNLDAVGASDVEASALSDRLREELLRVGKFSLVERQRLDAVLQEQSLQQVSCTGQQCAVEAGRLLGVKKIVTGRATKLGENSWQVSAQVVDVQTAETLRAESVIHEGRFVDLLQQGVPALAAKLAGDVKPQALVGGGAVSPGPVPEPPPAAPAPPPAQESAPAASSPALRIWLSPLTGFSQTLTLSYTDVSGKSVDVTETFGGAGISLGLEGFVAPEAALWFTAHVGTIGSWRVDSDKLSESLQDVDGSFSTVALGVDWVLALGDWKMLLGGGLFNTVTEFEGYSPAFLTTFKSDASLSGLLFQIRFDYTFEGGFMLGAGLDLGIGTATGTETEGSDTASGSVLHLYFPLGYSF